MYLVMKKVPKSVYKAGEELWFTKQRTDKPGGPQALSGQAELSGEWLTTKKLAQSIYLQTTSHLLGGLALEASNMHWQKFLRIMFTT